MSAKVLDLRSATKFVKKNGGDGVRWEGWDMIFFKEDPNGWSHVKGAFFSGKWGMQTRVTVSENGTWKVPSYVARRYRFEG